MNSPEIKNSKSEEKELHFHGLSHMPALSLSMIEIVWEAWEFLMVSSCR